MESFYMGCCIGFLVRLSTLKALKWPLTSLPLKSIPLILTTGVIFSTMDLLRRAKLEELMLKEQRAEINKQLRLDDKHYDL